MDRGQAAASYVLRVRGRLDPRWARRFDGCQLAHDTDGSTVITSGEIDQAALHGLLQQLRDLGLPLLSVTPAEQLPSATDTDTLRSTT